MRWRPIGQAAAVVAIAVVAFAVATLLGRPDDAELSFGQDVPDDVRVESDAVWSHFAERFDARMTCIDDVTVVLVGSVEGGDARYVVGESRIEIRIPTTPARYRESLAHELAHHVERTCADFTSLRTDLEPLLAADAESWWVGPTWEETPSEQFAEAVVEFVNGERVRHAATVPVDDEVLAVIRRWGVGDEPDPADDPDDDPDG